MGFILGWLVVITLYLFIRWFWGATAGWVDKKDREEEIERLQQRCHALECHKLSQDTFIIFVQRLLEQLDLEIDYIDNYHTHIKSLFSYPSEMYEIKKKNKGR